MTRTVTTVTLLPSKSIYGPDARIVVDVQGPVDHKATLSVHHLGELIAHFKTGGGPTDLGVLPVGGYRIELAGGPDAGLIARTAIDVVADVRHRMRYGFVVDFAPDRDPGAVETFVRRLHLTAVQFYDWAYRHADLLGAGHGNAQYADALSQPVSLDTVRRLIEAVHRAGGVALGYAAVYGVGNQEWPQWQHRALRKPSGEPYGLGDFLRLVDPSAPDWLAHFRTDLSDSVAAVGFDGFHLDQYGYPKRAVRADGVTVDLARAFDTMIEGVREELPESRLVFNNVNDFPTWATTSSPQDATYIEVWPPQVSLEDLARTVTRARLLAPERPVVIAAYQAVYDSEPVESADLATRFTMATLFSHGATQLLAGESGRLLVDPYYVRNHPAAEQTLTVLSNWYDFLVEHGELLMAPEIADVTGSYVGSYNGELDVRFAETPVSQTPVAGSIWRRVTQVAGRLVVHLINLHDQLDTLWDSGRQPVSDPGAGILTFRRTGPGRPSVRVADPDGAGRLVEVPVEIDGDDAIVRLPPLFVLATDHHQGTRS